jgi:hypothetical protein
MLYASTDANVERHSPFAQRLSISVAPRSSNARWLSSNYQRLSSKSQPLSPNSRSTEVLSSSTGVFARRFFDDAEALVAATERLQALMAVDATGSDPSA